MVANPADLVGGGSLQPYDSETESLGLRKFRLGEKPFVVNNNDGSTNTSGQ